MFAISAGMATFIENDFGTSAARTAVYNATWFEIMLVLLAVNLGGSIIVNRLWQRKKYFLFAFHASFIIILIGAAITRYFGTEGMLHIREGEASSEMVSEHAYITAKYSHSNTYTTVSRQVLMSGWGKNSFSFSFDLNGKDVDVETVEFIPNAAMVVSKSPDGDPIASLVVVNSQGRQTLVLKEGDRKNIGDMTISFGKSPGSSNITLLAENEKIFMVSSIPVTTTGMQEQITDSIPAFSKFELKPMLFYQAGGNRIVLRSFEPSGTLKPVTAGSGNQERSGLDAIRVNVTVDDLTKEVIVWGKRGIVGEFEPVEAGGLNFALAYGSNPIKLPFKIRLNKFILDRYPGSNSPSSYASEVTLIDESQGVTFDYRIFMNHILKHRGFRFYQSSYDNDEKGTILSVNYDGLGTTITYIGYFIMTLAMILALFSRRTRFGFILKQIKETRIKRTSVLPVFILLFLLGGAGTTNAGEVKTIGGKQVHLADKEHAERFGKLMVLSANGRLEPLNTLNSKIMRKFTGKSSFGGFNADQLMLGILAQPEVWQQIPVLKVKNQDVKKLINIKDNHASFASFFRNSQGNRYILTEYVDEAYQKESADQTKFDKEVINADEKVNIFYMVYSGGFLKLFPKSNNPGEKWYNPNDEVLGMPKDDSIFVKSIASLYVNALSAALESGDYTQANQFLGAIEAYQQKYAASVLPSKSKINTEIRYNNADIFERLFRFYGMFGLLFLIVLFVNLVIPKFRVKWLNRIFIGVLLIAFIFHTLGLAARWYISGHAPMSNGYESMIFIAWATMFAGFLLVRKSNIALAATTVLASLTLFVAHLNWMNPEVTNLVPVLKSIWLTIHVAVITSSYGFLGLGAILGLFNLMLMIFQNRKNALSFNLTIKEISFTSEATMTIGLYMLTIGTFLGAVWANESWGRYWGWDPKETWALVTVLVYAVIIHLNFIPGLMGRYLFNALSVLGFSSVLMTYFGVNYYLSGLHSYAAGDPVPIPAFVYYSIAILVIILVLAFFNQSKVKKLGIFEE